MVGALWAALCIQVAAVVVASFFTVAVKADSNLLLEAKGSAFYSSHAADNSFFINELVEDTYVLMAAADRARGIVDIGIVARTTGWVGFGIAEFTSGSMLGADVVTGGVDPGNHMYLMATSSITPIRGWTLGSQSLRMQLRR